MKIYCLGNPLVDRDRMPLKLLPLLQKQFPKIEFRVADPSEDCLDQESKLVIIDTVAGIDRVTVFDSLASFGKPKNVSLHDYDLGFHLRLLRKQGRLKKLLIIGVPPDLPCQEAGAQLVVVIRSLRSD